MASAEFSPLFDFAHSPSWKTSSSSLVLVISDLPPEIMSQGLLSTHPQNQKACILWSRQSGLIPWLRGFLPHQGGKWGPKARPCSALPAGAWWGLQLVSTEHKGIIFPLPLKPFTSHALCAPPFFSQHSTKNTFYGSSLCTLRRGFANLLRLQTWYRVSAGDEGKLLETDSSDGCTHC